MTHRQLKEKSIRWFFFGTAFVSILVLFLILLFLFVEGIPIFSKVSVFKFLFGRDWYPTARPPDFGFPPAGCFHCGHGIFRRRFHPPGRDDCYLPG